MLLYVPISEGKDMQILQEDLNTLEKWQDAGLMKFNPSRPFRPIKVCHATMLCHLPAVETQLSVSTVQFKL